VAAGNQSEVGDRFDELEVVWMPFKKRGKGWKPDLPYVLLLSTGPLFDAGKCGSKLV
jgi:hypothetical protein